MSTHSLKAQWGAPPKPNLWNVEYSVDHEGHKKWAVTSPAMAGAVVLFHDKIGSPEWWVNYYYDRKETHESSWNYKNILNYFAHRDGEMTDAECLEHFLSERFYMEVFKREVRNGVIELKVPKVASSKKLELQWGSPPKPNIWSSELIKGKKALYMLNHWLIRSPLMKGFILVFLPETAGEEIVVGYNRRKWTSSLIKTTAYRDMDVLYRGVDANLSYVQSQAFWEEEVVPCLGTRRLRGKVASSNLEAQWGDPVKSNLWKVEYDKAFTQYQCFRYTIKSPVLEGYFVVKMYPPSSAEIKFFDSTRGVTFAKYLSPITIGDILSRQFYLEDIKPAIYLTHEVRVKKGLKVASSDIKLQWGDPPKPNVWKVKERPGRGVKHHGYIFDISTPLDPRLNITIHQSPSMGARKIYRTTVFYGSICLIENAAGFLVSEGAHPADIFSTQYFWDRIKDEIRDKTPTSMKVASSNPQAMWGDPPKPNMWKVETLQRSKMVAVTRVISPILEGSIWLGVYGKVMYCPDDMMPSPLTEEKMRAFENSPAALSVIDITKIMGINPKRQFLSNKFYLEHLAPLIGEGRIKLKGNVRVASSGTGNVWREKSLDIKLQWGDPPKPNIWQVLEKPKYSARVKGEEGYVIHSPVLNGAIFLTFLQDKYSNLEYLERGKEIVHIRSLDRTSLRHSVHIIAKPRFWEQVIKPAIASRTIKVMHKLASPASSRKRKITLQWGDPPKPNLWLVEELMYGWEKIYRVLSPLMEGEIWLSNTYLVYYFPKGLGLPQKKLGLDYDLRGVDFGDSTYPMQRLKSANSEEHFLSHAYWSEHLKGRLTLKGRVASKKGK